jgi:acyl-ACP thioesterase
MRFKKAAFDSNFNLILLKILSFRSAESPTLLTRHYRGATMWRRAIMKERFELVLEPSDLWTVWDNETDAPVVFADRLLAGLARDEAEAARQVLVEVSRNRKKEKPADAA